MTGVSPSVTSRPRAAFSRRRWASRLGSTGVPGSPGLRQNISRSAKLRSGALRRTASSSMRWRMSPGAARPVAASKACSPEEVAPLRAFRPPSSAPGASVASACSRTEISCGRCAPGRGVGRVPSDGGMESGARVVTWNSSGASRVKPKVRAVSLPQAASQSGADRTTRRGSLEEGVELMETAYSRLAAETRRQRQGWQHPPRSLHRRC